jgi:antirestriction protein ArdC
VAVWSGRAFLCQRNPTLRHGGNRAYYTQALDAIQMSPFEAFRDAEIDYATLAHRLTHWTEHPQRLCRYLGRKSWGDAGYAAEELVAELGSALICADLNLAPETPEENAAYIASRRKDFRSEHISPHERACVERSDYSSIVYPRKPFRNGFRRDGVGLLETEGQAARPWSEGL